MKESIAYYSVKILGAIIRRLPLNAALFVGEMIGLLAYTFDRKRKSLAYSNIRLAFSKMKTPQQIRHINRRLFKNYGKNFVELFRMPLLNAGNFEQFVRIEGREHVDEALKGGKGAILLAMHFGSWEIASSSCAMLGYPYKVMVKPQLKYSRLDELLNSYRTFGGSIILSRGLNTRDFVKSLKNNEVIGMVVDQGGKDGMLVPFFGRSASMSVGAIRMALKMEVPLLFSIIIREKGGRHRMIIHKPLEIDKSDDGEKDIYMNLTKVTQIMEHYIVKYPSEYMWFYKIWKYSKETNITILDDGKMGHLRQSQTVCSITQDLLGERNILTANETCSIEYKNNFAYRLFSLGSFILPSFLFRGKGVFLKWFLKKESYEKLMSIKSDYIISCGSSLAGINYLLSKDQDAKSIVIQRPGLMPFKRFNLVVLPQHDLKGDQKIVDSHVAVTRVTPNLINSEYLKDQAQKLLERYSHLKNRSKKVIGLLIGGNSKNLFLSRQQISILVHQLLDVAKEIHADILVTTSRRTPPHIEKLLQAELKKAKNCPLLIIASSDSVPEAVGGILGLSDIVIVSGDSISMVSEAASSGKYTVVFSPQKKDVMLMGSNKHSEFVEKLNEQGFILSSNVKDVGQSIFEIVKNKHSMKKLNDNEIIREALRYII